MKRFIPLIFALFVYSCSTPLDKSIFEDLTFDELKEVMENDTIFEELYRITLEIRDSTLIRDIDRVKYSDLTYQDIYNYGKQVIDTSFWGPIYRESVNKWEASYPDYSKEIDSISNYWMKYKEENSPEGYVKIELVKIDKEYYSSINEVRQVNLGFKLTPLKGRIDQLKFRYKVEPKIDEDKEDNIYSSIGDIFDYTNCLMSQPFSRPVVRYWEVGYDNEDYFENATLAQFKRDFYLDIEVYELRKDGKNLRESDLDIPFEIRQYWEEKQEESSFMVDYYEVRIIEDFINPDYQSFNEYYSTITDSIAKSIDPLIYEYLNLE